MRNFVKKKCLSVAFVENKLYFIFFPQKKKKNQQISVPHRPGPIVLINCVYNFCIKRDKF